MLEKNMLNNLEDILDEEVDVYTLSNGIDDATAEELRFIAKSFAKFYKGKVESGEKNDLKILNDYEFSLKAISDGIFGTSFKTMARLLYKNLPTIRKMDLEANETTIKLIDELNAQKQLSDDFKKRNAFLEKEIKTLTDEIDRKDRLLKSRSTGSSSWSSAGSCGGGRSSAGRC
jgi:hypothetical protein